MTVTSPMHQSKNMFCWHLFLTFSNPSWRVVVCFDAPNALTIWNTSYRRGSKRSFTPSIRPSSSTTERFAAHDYISSMRKDHKNFSNFLKIYFLKWWIVILLLCRRFGLWLPFVACYYVSGPQKNMYGATHNRNKKLSRKVWQIAIIFRAIGQ